MRQQYTHAIKDGFIASFFTLASTGALIALAPNLSRTALAFGTSVFGLAATNSYQQNRLKDKLRLEIDNYLFQESVEIQQSIALLRESITEHCDKISAYQNYPLENSEEQSTQDAGCSDLSRSLSTTIDESTAVQNSVRQTQSVVDWLHQMKINVESHIVDHSPTAEAMRKMAFYLGTHYTVLKPLHRMIKRHIETGSRFKISLADKTQREIQICTNFFNRLHQLSLLSYYRYSRQDKMLQAASQKRPDIDEFFRGGWFETYIANTVEDILHTQRVDYQYLSNATVTFASGDRFELDLLFLVNGKPLWIECKSTRDFNRHLKQYSQHREHLGIDKERSFLVALDLQSHQADVMTDMWGITVTNQYDLIPKINALLKNEASTSTVVRAESSSTVSQLFSDNFSKLLRQKRIYPLPKNRITVLQEFVHLINTTEKALTFREIKEHMASIMQDISRNRLQSVLRTILHTHSLLSETGEVVTNFQTPIRGLEISDIEQLDQLCVNHYAAIALSHNPDYFSNRENCQEFKLVVGSDVPSAEVIQQIRNSAA